MLFLTDTLPTISDGHPVLAHAYVYTAQLLMAVKLVFLPVLCVLFFQKRSSVPTLMIILYVWRIAELIFEAFCYHALDLERFRWQFDYGDIVRALVPAAIWVPYFIASSRVKDTFIRRRVVQGPLTTT